MDVSIGLHLQELNNARILKNNDIFRITEAFWIIYQLEVWMVINKGLQRGLGEGD